MNEIYFFQGQKLHIYQIHSLSLVKSQILKAQVPIIRPVVGTAVKKMKEVQLKY